MRSGPDEQRTFYRIVRTDPPTARDFTSAAARGRAITANLPEELHRLWDGLSVYATLQQARRKARKSPMLGAYIAELRVTDGGSIRSDRTTREPGHHTLWGDATDLLRCVTSVRAVAVTTESKEHER